MALVRNRVNALNVLGLRKVKHLPPNFNRMTLSLDYIHKLKDIDRWIYANLDSRYCIRQVQSVTDDNKMVMVIEIGMEDSKELTFLTLSCPFINP